MAGDWIKMRVALNKHPKVIAIADALASDRLFMDWLTDPFRQTCDKSAHERVTRSVTVSVTVCALMQVWGVANDLGRADGDDLLLTHATLSTLDEIAGVPGIGRAMASVGWAVEEPEGNVRFNNFLIYNIPSEDRKRHLAAARQRAKRERDKSVTDDVTVTQKRHGRAEESREDKKAAKQLGQSVFSKLSEEQLADTKAMITWFAMASSQARPVIAQTERNLLHVICAADRALEAGKKPVALFAKLVSAGNWDFITNEREQRAEARLRAQRVKPPPNGANGIMEGLKIKSPEDT